jgi:amino acid transporter
MQNRRGDRCLGGADRVHVRLHVPHAKDRLRDGQGWAYFQVRASKPLVKQKLICVCFHRDLSRVLPFTGTPVLATLCSGLAASVAALFILLVSLKSRKLLDVTFQLLLTSFLYILGYL